jgi:hypothetical protein
VDRLHGDAQTRKVAHDVHNKKRDRKFGGAPKRIETPRKRRPTGTTTAPSIIIGYYEGGDLVFVARTRNGFLPGSRRNLYQRLKPLIRNKCPFSNLPNRDRFAFVRV